MLLNSNFNLNYMKFAHIADVHIGGWREPKLSDLSVKAFKKSVKICISRQVDFVLIAGDLFNTSLPSIDRLKVVVHYLRKLKNNDINVYIIAGSHDFSPSGKTMLEVLEEAGLVINVVKGKIVDNKLKLNFTIDGKTGAKITGMLGKKGMLEKKYYENLLKHNLEKEEGYKIFMFHSALQEFKPPELANMDAHPLSLLPKHFNYYAGGHVHYIFSKEEKDYGLITYPGALFPNNFAEMEKYGKGGFYIVEDDKLEYVDIELHPHVGIKIDVNHNTPLEVENMLLKKVTESDVQNSIVTIRLKGILENGKISDIDFNRIFERGYEKGAFFVMKNTSALKTAEFEELKIEAVEAKVVEDNLIKEHLGQIQLGIDDEEKLIHQLMRTLNTYKQEGERVIDFEKRVIDDMDNIVNKN